MKKIKNIFMIHIFLIVATQSAAMEKPMFEIRTYMSFTYPIDQAKIETISDMDLSYALAATLVEWDTQKQISKGLADKWQILSPKTYRFFLRPNAKWSNGEAISSQQIKKSFERGFEKYPNEWRSLNKIVEKIDCPSSREIDFHLHSLAKESNLLGKLTEPNYGVTMISSGNSADPSISTGPFYVFKSSNQELTLQRNPNWFHFSDDVAEHVVIKRTPPNTDSQRVLLIDPWPNLTYVTSLAPDSLFKEYQDKKLEIWRRPMDKVFLLELGKRQRTKSGFKLLQVLNSKLSRKEVTHGFTGISEANQLFTGGFELYDKDFSGPQHITEKDAREFQGAKLTILHGEHVLPQLLANLNKAITSVLGAELRFMPMSLEDAFRHKAANDYDIYAGAYGLADPDIEGIMSFYFENSNPVIPSNDENFLPRIDSARKETNETRRVKMMRDIVTDSVRKGHVLPLFHFSLVGLAKSDLDLQHVPKSDETVTLAKVRYRGK